MMSRRTETETGGKPPSEDAIRAAIRDGELRRARPGRGRGGARRAAQRSEA